MKKANRKYRCIPNFFSFITSAFQQLRENPLKKEGDMLSKKMAVVVVFAFALALGLAQVAHAGSLSDIPVVKKIDVSTPVLASVYDPCMKEYINFSGNVLTVAITVTTPGGIVNAKLLSNYRGVTGVGQISGQTYQLSSSSSTNLTQRVVEGGDLETINYTEHELGALAGNNALFSFQTHYTVTPSGDVVSSFTDFEVKCTGQTVGETPDESGACFDGIDNDADGLTDCADTDCAGAVNGACNTGLPGVCASGTLQCTSSVLMCSPANAPQAEICDDGLDNDCNGLTDVDDPACAIIQ
jgi:hypothetical protein